MKTSNQFALVLSLGLFACGAVAQNTTRSEASKVIGADGAQPQTSASKFIGGANSGTSTWGAGKVGAGNSLSRLDPSDASRVSKPEVKQSELPSSKTVLSNKGAAIAAPGQTDPVIKPHSPATVRSVTSALNAQNAKLGAPVQKQSPTASHYALRTNSIGTHDLKRQRLAQAKRTQRTVQLGTQSGTSKGSTTSAFGTTSDRSQQSPKPGGSFGTTDNPFLRKTP